MSWLSTYCSRDLGPIPEYKDPASLLSPDAHPKLFPLPDLIVRSTVIVNMYLLTQQDS